MILGHSERRADHGERSSDVQAKAAAAHRAGLAAIVCIGETAGERKGRADARRGGAAARGLAARRATAADTVIAYEPVWAIGTGLTPSAADVAEVHGFLRRALVERFGAEGRGHAHPLRRLGEARQCARVDGRCQR